MKSVKTARTACLSFVFLMAYSSVWASLSSLGFDVSGGVGTSGYSINGNLGLPPLSDAAATQVSLSYAYQHATTGTESKSQQYVLGLSNKVSDNLEGHGALNYWKDTLNDIHYAGPSFGFTYTWTGASMVTQASPPEATDEKPAPSAEGPTSETPPPADEVAALSLNSDIFIYGTDISATSSTRTVVSPVTHRLVRQVIPGGTANEHVTQFHPSISFEVPLFQHQVTPSVTVGHYFYSKNPGDLEALIGRPRFAGSANQINGLVGGFLNNNAETALQFTLPGDLDMLTRMGVEQSVSDNKWSTTQGVTLNRTFFDHVRAKLDWSRSIQTGISSDVFTGGLTYQF